MRVTKAMLESTIKHMLRSSKKVQKENQQLRQLLIANAWLVKPTTSASLSIVDVRPGNHQFNLSEGFTGDTMVDGLCRSEVQKLIGSMYLPGVRSYTDIAIVPLKRRMFAPHVIASQQVLR